MYILLGAHGTGKSSLLAEIKNRISDYYVTDGFSRPAKVIKEELNLDKNQEQVMINELTCHAFESYIGQNVISTRSPIDAILYTEYYNPALDTHWMQEVFDNHKDKIEGIFYIPIEFELKDDGVRFTNKEDQKNIDIMMRKFINDNDLEVIPLTGTIEERVKKFFTAILVDRFTEAHKQL